METQDFNVENPLQRQPAKLHYIGSVFTNAVGYLMMRSNPSRRLTRSIYKQAATIHTPTAFASAQASGDGPRFAPSLAFL
jgi:hypothetical protein